MPKHAGAGVIQHHAGDMEHTPHHVDSVFRAVKMLREFFRHTARKLHLHIVPCVNVDFLDALPIDIFGQEPELRHLGIDGGNQFLRIHARHGYPVVLDVFAYKTPYLRPGILTPLRRDQTAVFFGKVRLDLL